MELGPRPSSTPAPDPTPLIGRKDKTPLATKLLEQADAINPQLGSPLFSQLPREIRELIWRFSLTRFEDLDRLYPIGRRYARPDRAAPLRTALDLLRTCRAIYVEAYLIPFEVNPFVVHDGDLQDLPPLVSPHQCMPGDLGRYEKLKPWQLAHMSSVEMTVQQFQLEGGSVERVSRLVGALGRHKGHECKGFTLQGSAHFTPPRSSGADTPSEVQDGYTRLSPSQDLPVGKRITSLTIRMLRTDWWTWSSSPQEGSENPRERLRLEPLVNTTKNEYLAMTRGYEARKEGAEPDFGLDGFEKEGRWGTQITEYWPDLATLELVLETFACKESQLDYVVECAKLWTFPVGNEYRLVYDGLESVRWRGANAYGYEGSFSWIGEENKAQSGEQNATVIQWRPTSDDDDGESPQEFVIKTLKYKRRRREREN
ncbi:hypothetical protein GGR53DRAFT_518626 [Hypoxylon sp. FL1150]|nr:hypothetical protein GGR53DRAFT_518626 [Hypoxylon sp. FL1150]